MTATSTAISPNVGLRLSTLRKELSFFIMVRTIQEEVTKRYTANVYAAGQALFDANDPTRFITRLDEPFFRPMDSFEKSGQYVDGTVFIEGMVYFKNKWYLYYGCADSKVGVAVYDPKRPAKADPLP